MNTPDAANPSALKHPCADAELEPEQFERRLKLAQTALPKRPDPRTVAMNIAAQQEIDALRGALRERDRIGKELTEHVCGLEDRLEDDYRRSDEIERQLKQCKEELDDARRKLGLAVRRVESLRAAAETPAADASVAPLVPDPAAARPARAHRQQQQFRPHGEPRRRAGPSRFVPGLLVGLLTGLLVADSAAGTLWRTGNLPEHRTTALASTPAAATHATNAAFAR
jgi:hypothetical protein